MTVTTLVMLVVEAVDPKPIAIRRRPPLGLRRFLVGQGDRLIEVDRRVPPSTRHVHHVCRPNEADQERRCNQTENRLPPGLVVHCKMRSLCIINAGSVCLPCAGQLDISVGSKPAMRPRAASPVILLK